MILWKDTALGTGQLHLHFQFHLSLVCNQRVVANCSAHVQFWPDGASDAQLLSETL